MGSKKRRNAKKQATPTDLMRSMAAEGIGALSAEHDKDLIENFIDDIPALSLAENFSSRKYILLGRTGSGKSAIIQKIKHDCIENKFFYAFIDKGEDDLDRIISESRKELGDISTEDENIIFKLAWHYAIVINLLKSKYPDPDIKNFQLFTDRDREIYEFIKNISPDKLYTMTISELFNKLVRTVKLSISQKVIGGTVKADIDPKDIFNERSRISAQKSHQVLQETKIFVREKLPNILGKNKAYILIDDLDIGWNPKSSSQQRLVSSLFTILQEYLYQENFKPVIALRTDIFDGLKMHQREKQRDQMIEVSWTDDLLEEMLARRIMSIFDVEDYQFLNTFFVGEIDGTPLIKYMISKTLNRPRDLLDFCNKVIKEANNQGSTTVQACHVSSVFIEYSIDRVHALSDEWKSIYPGIESLLDEIAGFATISQIESGFLAKEFQLLLSKIQIRISDKSREKQVPLKWFPEKFSNLGEPRLIFELLYKLGIICVQKKSKIYQESTEEIMPDVFEPDTHIKIHPMFSPYIQNCIGRESDRPLTEEEIRKIISS